jgi:hypothetical protein
MGLLTCWCVSYLVRPGNATSSSHMKALHRCIDLRIALVQVTCDLRTLDYESHTRQMNM